MRCMGLVFGALDLIVTPDEEYLFLEINEQGQFLWIEDYNPEFKMLDIFLHFLINCSLSYEWKPASKIHSMSDYSEAIKPIQAQNRLQHIDSSRN